MEWKTIPGFVNYEVSEYGDVRNVGVGKGIRAGRMLKGKKTEDGYRSIALSSKGLHYFLVHRLVNSAFNGPCPIDKPYTCHRDGDPANNHYSNLYWATQQENMNDMIRHGKSTKGRPAPNEGKPCSAEQRVKISLTLTRKNNRLLQGVS